MSAVLFSFFLLIILLFSTLLFSLRYSFIIFSTVLHSTLFFSFFYSTLFFYSLLYSTLRVVSEIFLIFFFFFVHHITFFFSGPAKLTMWLTRKNRAQNVSSVEPVPVPEGLLKARLIEEHAIIARRHKICWLFVKYGLLGGGRGALLGRMAGLILNFG